MKTYLRRLRVLAAMQKTVTALRILATVRFAVTLIRAGRSVRVSARKGI